MSQSREVRNERLLEEAGVMRVAVNSGFSGDDSAFESLRDAYAPADLREAEEAAKIQQSVKQITRLFSGG